MIIIKDKREIELMRESGKIAAEAMAILLEEAKPGITTGELDKIAYKAICSYGATPSFLNYRGFPASICASVNDEIVHGIPGKRVLKDGDILTIDMGACYKGYHSDMARTVPVGEVSEQALNLIKVTEECHILGVRKAIAGNRICDISRAIENHAHNNGMTVVHDLVGHGIGQSLHEAPDVPNFVSKIKGPVLKPGMTIAIEPMVNLGVKDVVWSSDGWTVRTKDGKFSAQYENTVAVTEGEPDVLTVF